ncbi:Hsp20/alpha crystallin family protein [Verrucomicrobiaceae bacterium 227]
MTLINRIPNNLFGNLDELLSQTLRNFGPSPAAKAPGAYRYQTNDSYRLRLDLPGFNRDEVSLTLEKSELKVVARTEREDAFRSEFERAYNLPDDVDPEGIEAKMTDGVLDLTFKKVTSENRGVRNIEIN